MKLVFTEEEVAEALQKSPAEFSSMRRHLEDLGFPRPLLGLEDRWSIIDVANWVNRSTGRSAPQLPPEYLGRMMLS